MSARLKVPSVCLTALCLFGLPAAADEPPFPIEPELTEPATLRHQYEPGTSLRYQVTFEIEELASNLAANRSDQKQMSGTFELVIGVRQQDVADSRFIYEEIRNASVNLEQNGSSVSDRRVVRALEGTIRALQVTALGVILDQEVSPLGNSGGFDDFIASIRQWSSLFTSARWSPEPVVAGQSWTADDLLPPQRTQSELEVTASATFTFRGYARVDGTVTAVVEIGLEVWQELPDGRDVADYDDPALFRGVGHGYMYVDPAQGRVLHGVFDYGVVGQAGDPGQRTDVTRTASFQLQLL